MARVNGDARRQASGDLFPTDNPIPASQMIGRTDDVRELALALESATNCIIAGPRRTGKTSVCEAALLHAAKRGHYVARVDLFRLADAGELAEALIASMLQNRPKAYKAAERARRLGRKTLSAAQAALTTKLTSELGDGVELAITPGLSSHDPQKALVTALEFPQRVAMADRKHCIVFFDEFQELANPRAPFGDPDQVTKQMRAVFQRSSDVSYLFAGSIEHVMRDLFAPEHRAFSSFGSFMQLRPIATEDWTAGLRARFAADGVSIFDTALEHLVDMGELHPRVTMLIAQKTHYLSIVLDTREITTDLVTQGYELAYQGDLALLDQLIERIRRAHKFGLRLARRIARSETLSTGIQPAQADRAVKKLLEAGIVEQLGRGRYRIFNPLLRRRLAERDWG
jgi:DNA-binding transcriptional ArsR family regulator/adenosyl cobinamide kinase/adenosyl cobinamide phosphate guanylyltransferase